jgi:hypothetical protein
VVVDLVAAASEVVLLVVADLVVASVEEALAVVEVVAVGKIIFLITF